MKKTLLASCLLLSSSPSFALSGDMQFAAELNSGAAEINKAAQPAPEDAEKKRVESAIARLIEQAKKKMAADRDGALEDFSKGLAAEAKASPRFAEDLYKIMLAGSVEISDVDKQRALAADVAANAPTPDLKKEAADLVKRLDDLQRPLQIQFTAVDGTAVDVSSMPGKVVLVDFWATWCGPCVRGLPDVLKTYAALHPKGFEIVGISFDQDRKSLDALVKALKIPWPQYFDGQGWQNKFGAQYGIGSIPTLWLVDKKGRLRYLNAREGLEAKVQKLLSEP